MRGERVSPRTRRSYGGFDAESKPLTQLENEPRLGVNTDYLDCCDHQPNISRPAHVWAILGREGASLGRCLIGRERTSYP